MPQTVAFYPPKLNPVACTLLGALLPPVLKHYCCVKRIVVADDDLDRLREVAKGRMILSANHPTRVDPLIIAEMTRRSGKRFYFVSARENFQNALGPLLQAVGGYSIVRGAPDRASMSMTRKLIAEEDARVVLFPEGDVYHHNDTTLPFHSGVSQLGFWALADLAKAGKDVHLPLLPAAVRYRYLGDMTGHIESRFDRLAKYVGAENGGGYYLRCRAIGEKIIESLEHQYRIEPAGHIPERIEGIKTAILERVAGTIGVTVDSAATMPDKVRAVFNAVYDYCGESADNQSEYEHRLAQQRADLVRPLTIDLWRVYNCMAVTGRYVTDHPTYERLAELLGRLEELVFGKANRHHPREAFVRFGEPIDLGARFDAYKSDKRATADKATTDLESAIRDLLGQMAHLSTPIPADKWGPQPEVVSEPATFIGEG